MTWLSEQYDLVQRGDIQLSLERMDAARLCTIFQAIETKAQGKTVQIEQFMVPKTIVALYEIMLKPSLLENAQFSTSPVFFQLLSAWKPAESNPPISPILISYGIIKMIECVNPSIQRWAQAFTWTDHHANDLVPVFEHTLRHYEYAATQTKVSPAKPVFYRPPSSLFFDAMTIVFRRLLNVSEPSLLFYQIQIAPRILALIRSKFIPPSYGAKIMGNLFEMGSTAWTGDDSPTTLIFDIVDTTIAPLLQPGRLVMDHVKSACSAITSLLGAIETFSEKDFDLIVNRLSNLLAEAYKDPSKVTPLTDCIKRLAHRCFRRKPAIACPAPLRSVWTSLVDPSSDILLLKAAMAAEADFMYRSILEFLYMNQKDGHDIFPQRMIVSSVIDSSHLPMLLVKCAPLLLLSPTYDTSLSERHVKFSKAIVTELISTITRETGSATPPHSGLKRVMPMVAPYFMVNESARNAFLGLWQKVLAIRDPNISTTHLLTVAFLTHTSKGLRTMLHEVAMFHYDCCKTQWRYIADFTYFMLNSTTFITPPDEHLAALSEIREETILLVWMFVKHVMTPIKNGPNGLKLSTAELLRFRHAEALPDVLKLVSTLLTYYRENSAIAGAIAKPERWVSTLIRVPHRLVDSNNGTVTAGASVAIPIENPNKSSPCYVNPELMTTIQNRWRITMDLVCKVLTSKKMTLSNPTLDSLKSVHHLIDITEWQPLFKIPVFDVQKTSTYSFADPRSSPKRTSASSAPTSLAAILKKPQPSPTYGSSGLTSNSTAQFLGVSRPGPGSPHSGSKLASSSSSNTPTAKPSSMSVALWAKSAPAGPQSSYNGVTPSVSVKVPPPKPSLPASSPYASLASSSNAATVKRPLPATAAPKKLPEPPAVPTMTLQERKEHDAEIQRQQNAKRKRDALAAHEAAETPLQIVSAVRGNSRENLLLNQRLQHNDALKHRTRSLEDLHEKVLALSYNSLNFPVEDTTVTKRIPNKFRNHDEYLASFEPLLLLELQTQIQNAKEELVVHVETKQLRYISELGRFHEATVEKSPEWQNGDVLIMWPRDEFGSDFRRFTQKPDAPHCLGVLAKDKKKKQNTGASKGFLSIEKNTNKDVAIRVILAGDPSDHRAGLFPKFQIGSDWCFCKLYSMGTVCREWQALQTVHTLSGFSEILNPTLGDGIQFSSYHPAQVKELVPKLSTERKFNDSQRKAIFDATQRKGFSFIQGPPGTGKTRTLIGLLSMLMALQAAPILVCTPSNSAIDEVINRMCENGLYDMSSSSADAYTKQFRVVRVGRPSDGATDKVKQVLLSVLKEHVMASRRVMAEEAENIILKGSDIVCCTLSTSGSGALSRANIAFKTVIIDEAAQAVELATLIPLQHRCEQCILIGDPQQLPATVFSSMASKYLYERSMFARFTETMDPARVLLLNTQYRMHPQISLFPNKHFYKGLLLDGTKPLNSSWSNSSTYFSPLRFFDLQQSSMSSHSNSLGNPDEVDFVVGMIKKLVSLNPKISFQDRIVVITPYQTQRNLLQSSFSKQTEYPGVFSSIDVATVDSFQGKEKTIVILSTVRAKGGKSIGFLADVRRLNVALTRAQQSLWIVGQSATLNINPEWNALLTSLEERKLITAVNKKAKEFWPSC
jgi:hypothetical protein